MSFRAKRGTPRFDCGGSLAVSAAQDDSELVVSHDGMIESPFDKTIPPFEESTGDEEPMLVSHDESPFEEPVENATAAAFAIEQPEGIHIDEADVFAPVVADTPAPPPVAEEITNTLTMAELYERQGLPNEAQHIYENILARDPNNRDVQAKLEAITPHVNQKIDKLERWLEKVSRKEVGRV